MNYLVKGCKDSSDNIPQITLTKHKVIHFINISLFYRKMSPEFSTMSLSLFKNNLKCLQINKLNNSFNYVMGKWLIILLNLTKKLLFQILVLTTFYYPKICLKIICIGLKFQFLFILYRNKTEGVYTKSLQWILKCTADLKLQLELNI